jgi:DNA-binding MarR family transcriptional regulator
MALDRKDIRDEVLIAFRRITRAIDLHSSRLAHHHGLTAPQLTVLGEISRSGEITAGQLAGNVSLSNATITGILNRLSKRGLIERRRADEDKRCVLVKLTDLGKRTLANAPSLLHDRFVKEFEKLENWEQTLLLSSLQRIASMMEVKDLDAVPMLASREISEVTEAPLPDRSQLFDDLGRLFQFPQQGESPLRV